MYFYESLLSVGVSNMWASFVILSAAFVSSFILFVASHAIKGLEPFDSFGAFFYFELTTILVVLAVVFGRERFLGATS